jgi:glutamyl-tRNA synthetase
MWLAQWNYLFARQNNGSFIIRIEDTDQQRFVPGATEKIYEALDWLGMTPDEGPLQGGEYGPYIQSQRLSMYQDAAKQLIASGHAYYCFCTPERLTELRERQAAAKLPPRYDKLCCTLSKEDVAKKIAAGEKHVVRLNMPSEGTLTFTDSIRGEVSFQYATVDDSVLLKSDGFPTYHLAVVVDDHAMKISHVIRAEEWLSSVPKHLYLYECFGWEAPEFAHLPWILGADKTKLSKRHGAVSALSYRKKGYLPETLQNFFALMGWHPKGDDELLSRERVIEEFRLGDIHPSGAIFDQQKLDWLQGQYIRAMDIPTLTQRALAYWTLPASRSNDTAWQQRVIAAVQDRLVFLADITSMTNVFLPEWWDTTRATFSTDDLIPKKGTADDVRAAISWMIKQVSALDESILCDASKMRTEILNRISAAGLSNGTVLWPVRVAISLQKNSPDVFAMMAVLGKEESLRRLRGV